MIKTCVEGAQTASVVFELPPAVGAGSATVCGDFNDWSPAAHPLTPTRDGGFTTVIELPTGRRWRFRYLLDGRHWENDWAADAYEPNGHGSEDSVVDLTVAAPAAEPAADIAPAPAAVPVPTPTTPTPPATPTRARSSRSTSRTGRSTRSTSDGRGGRTGRRPATG